jgi:hypothetical protein
MRILFKLYLYDAMLDFLLHKSFPKDCFTNIQHFTPNTLYYIKCDIKNAYNSVDRVFLYHMINDERSKDLYASLYSPRTCVVNGDIY